MIDHITEEIINNFDFTLMLMINILTYIIIKLMDKYEEQDHFSTWKKRIVFVLVSISFGILYKSINDIPAIVAINSCIAAPIVWGWFAKPIANKLGIDYKHVEFK